MFRTSVLITTLFLLFISCDRSDLGPAPVSDRYQEEINEWIDNRIESLTAPTGYMRLAGMYWLDEGENSFGSGSDRDVHFPEGTIPAYAGSFIYENGEVTMQVADGVTITHLGEPVREMTLYDGEETPAAEHSSLEWKVIAREDLVGIRLYNKENEKADTFTGFERYPLNPVWHLKARFVPNPENTTVSIANVLGQQMDVTSPGVLEFSIDGEIYTLQTLEGSSRLFVIVGDSTNRTETYQAGRYLYIDYPEEGSEYTVIDFNKAYNPPCAFSRFTTCQLPPPQNRLDVAITAGEKRPVGWDGL